MKFSDTLGKTNPERRFLASGLFFGMILGVILGLIGSWSFQRQSFQAEAVKEGHAKYVIVNEYGKAMFTWLPAHGDEKPFPAKIKKEE
jgi:hypothetical protein